MSGTKKSHTPRPSIVGVNLKRLRELAGLTQEQLAEKSGVSRTNVGFIEAGQRQRPNSDTLTKLAKALGCDVDDLTTAPVDGQPMGPFVDAFVTSEQGRRLHLSEDEIAWLRTLSTKNWLGIRPTTEALQFLILAHRSGAPQ